MGSGNSRMGRKTGTPKTLQFFPFDRRDLADYLNIYDSVAADYFLPEDRVDFADFLTHYNDPFFIGRLDGTAAACGGFRLKTPHLASLTWGIVHKRFQRRGLGAELLLYRIKAAHQLGAEQVEIRTSQLTEGFFQKHGFTRTRLVEDGLGPGIHLVEMCKDLITP